MTGPATSETTTSEPSATNAGTTSPSWLYYVAAVLAGVVVVCAGTLVYLFVHESDTGSASARFTDLFGGSDATSQDQTDIAAVNADRSAAMAVADQFVLRVNTYGPGYLDAQNKMPTYVSHVYAVSTAKLQASFDTGVTLAEQSVAQTGVSRSVDLFATGASSVDQDSATVLVAGALNQSYPNPKAPKAVAKRIMFQPVPFRFAVKLVKIDGTWKVDDFNPVVDAAAGANGTTQPSQGTTRGTTSAPSSPRASATSRPSSGASRGPRTSTPTSGATR